MIKAPLRFLVPVVMVLSVLGSYAISRSMVGPITVGAFGIVGWLMRRYGFSVPAAVVGVLVGNMAEN